MYITYYFSRFVIFHFTTKITHEYKIDNNEVTHSRCCYVVPTHKKGNRNTKQSSYCSSIAFRGCLSRRSSLTHIYTSHAVPENEAYSQFSIEKNLMR